MYECYTNFERWRGFVADCSGHLSSSKVDQNIIKMEDGCKKEFVTLEGSSRLPEFCAMAMPRRTQPFSTVNPYNTQCGNVALPIFDIAEFFLCPCIKKSQKAATWRHWRKPTMIGKSTTKGVPTHNWVNFEEYAYIYR